MAISKIELNHNKISRISSLDELAVLLFPNNRSHQRIFLAVFIELKYAPGGFLSNLTFLSDRYGFSPRMLETVRGKMRCIGIIDHVSRFNKKYGYREGWVFSSKFARSLERLIGIVADFKERKCDLQEKKDREAFNYI